MAANREDFEAMPQAACPMSVGEVDLFAPGAQEHWYDSYKLLQDEEPVLRLPGQGYEPGADAYVLTKYEDIRRVVRDPDLFPSRQGPGSSGTSKIHDEIFEDEGFGEVVTARERLRARYRIAQVAPRAADGAVGGRLGSAPAPRDDHGASQPADRQLDRQG